MIELPFPPSVNRLWRQFKGRTILSAEGRAYRKAVQDCLWGSPYPDGFMAGDLSVSIVAHLPDARRRDVDNLLKAALDGLTHAGLWADDSQIKRLTIERAGIDRDRPRLEVTVNPVEEA